MERPKYYFAMFGDPDPPKKDKVESGTYHLGIRGTDIPGEPGDIILLYCTSGYMEHFMEVPGIGIILNKDTESIYYRYLPLSSPISKEYIDKYFADDDLAKYNNRRFSSFWCFEISRESFCGVLRNISINWP